MCMDDNLVDILEYKNRIKNKKKARDEKEEGKMVEITVKYENFKHIETVSDVEIFSSFDSNASSCSFL